MPFTTRRAGNVGTIIAPEQLIVGNQREFEAVLKDEGHKDLGNAPEIEADFSGSNYIDSSGLGALVRVDKFLKGKGRQFRILNLNDDLKVLMELTKLDTLFNIVESRPAKMSR